MKLIILILLLFSGSTFACDGFHVEIGAGKNGNFTGSSVPWDDGGGVAAYFGLRYYGKLGVCQYSHYSQWEVGPPFNDAVESSLDHIGCALTFKIK